MRKKIIIVIGIVAILGIGGFAGNSIHNTNLATEKKLSQSRSNLSDDIVFDTVYIQGEESNTKITGTTSLTRHYMEDVNKYKESLAIDKKVLDNTDSTQQELDNADKNIKSMEDAYASSPTIDGETVVRVSAPVAPTIGMTSKEVMNSTWGNPENKNITKSANGNSEQWVYTDYKYIYLDNNIVTSIQTH